MFGIKGMFGGGGGPSVTIPVSPPSASPYGGRFNPTNTMPFGGGVVGGSAVAGMSSLPGPAYAQIPYAPPPPMNGMNNGTGPANTAPPMPQTGPSIPFINTTEVPKNVSPVQAGLGGPGGVPMLPPVDVTQNAAGVPSGLAKYSQGPSANMSPIPPQMSPVPPPMSPRPMPPAPMTIQPKTSPTSQLPPVAPNETLMPKTSPQSQLPPVPPPQAQAAKPPANSPFPLMPDGSPAGIGAGQRFVPKGANPLLYGDDGQPLPAMDPGLGGPAGGQSVPGDLKPMSPFDVPMMPPGGEKPGFLKPHTTGTDFSKPPAPVPGPRTPPMQAPRAPRISPADAAAAAAGRERMAAVPELPKPMMGGTPIGGMFMKRPPKAPQERTVAGIPESQWQHAGSSSDEPLGANTIAQTGASTRVAGTTPLNSGGYKGYATVPENETLALLRARISKVESEGSGGYAARGPVVKSGRYKGERAMGKYQVMPGNLPSWSRAALGREVSVAEFMANPAIQDAIFDHQMKLNLAKFGNARDAASVWFTGSPYSKGKNKSDGYNSGASYISKAGL